MCSVITQKVILELVPRTPGKINLEIKYDLPQTVTSLRIALPSNIIDLTAKGFTIDEYTCTWEPKHETYKPTIQTGLNANEGSDRGGYGYVDTGDWAIIKVPRFGIGYHYRGSGIDFRRKYRVRGAGVVSDDGSIAYLGPHEEYRQRATTTNECFRLIVPEIASLEESPEQILKAFVHAADLLEIGANNENVLAIAAPAGNVTWASKGRQRGDDGFWVRDDARLDNPNEAWIHEYVHTRQRFRHTESTHWLKEGTADYFAALACLSRGDINFDTFHQFLSEDRDSGAILANKKTWSSSKTVYTRGRRACAALDSVIRRQHGHNRSLADVIALINKDFKTDRHGNTPELTHQDLVEYLAQISGSRFDDWFERYVWDRQLPEIPYDQEIFELKDDSESGPDQSTGNTRGNKGKQSSTEIGEKGAADTCPACGVITDAQYCPECGFELKAQCPVCGDISGPNVEFCATCGTKLRS